MPGRSVLLQYASGHPEGEFIPCLQLTRSRHAAYSAQLGVEYHALIDPGDEGGRAHWVKYALLRQLLEQGVEMVAWLEPDTLVTDITRDWRATLAGLAALRLVHQPPFRDQPGGWDPGVMFLRNTPEVRAWLTAVLEAGPLPGTGSRDQPRVHAMLQQHYDWCAPLENTWNCLPEHYRSDAIIRSWHEYEHGVGKVSVLHDELMRLGDPHVRERADAMGVVYAGNAHERMAQFIETRRTPPIFPRERGIVICAGGLGYFTCAWVGLHQLRRVGCTLPIQLWYLGRREMNETMRALIEPLGVECVDALPLAQQFGLSRLTGWASKPFSIWHSPFRQVLFLDADNVPVRNPEFLFDSEPFAKHGAVFWPDYCRMPPDRSAWQAFGVPYRDEWEFESGQLLVDKSRCWRALELAHWFNQHDHFFYNHVHGDKDTFRFAWHKLGLSYAMPPFPVQSLEGVMCQHDFDGQRLFQHRNSDKWNWYQDNRRIEGFLFEAECQGDVHRLRELWDGRI
jgi:hypothetical protein